MNTTNDNGFFPSSSSAPFRTSDKRWGVRSWDPIAAGTFISEYTGQVVPVTEHAAICHSESEYVLNLKRAKKKTEWGSISDILCEQQQARWLQSSFPTIKLSNRC
jgi:hypothetical protein